MVTIKAPGKYRTADGQKATLVYGDSSGFIGYLEKDSGRLPRAWSSSGQSTDGNHEIDLEEPWNDRITGDVEAFIFLDKRGAIMVSHARPDPKDYIGIRKIQLSVKEGDKL